MRLKVLRREGERERERGKKRKEEIKIKNPYHNSRFSPPSYPAYLIRIYMYVYLCLSIYILPTCLALFFWPSQRNIPTPKQPPCRTEPLGLALCCHASPASVARTLRGGLPSPRVAQSYVVAACTSKNGQREGQGSCCSSSKPCVGRKKKTIPLHG